MNFRHIVLPAAALLHTPGPQAVASKDADTAKGRPASRCE